MAASFGVLDMRHTHLGLPSFFNQTGTFFFLLHYSDLVWFYFFPSLSPPVSLSVRPTFSRSHICLCYAHSHCLLTSDFRWEFLLVRSIWLYVLRACVCLCVWWVEWGYAYSGVCSIALHLCWLVRLKHGLCWRCAGMSSVMHEFHSAVGDQGGETCWPRLCGHTEAVACRADERGWCMIFVSFNLYLPRLDPLRSKISVTKENWF